MFLNPTNDLEVMIIKSCWYCWKFLFELKEVAYRLWNLSLKKARFAVTPNSKIIGNSRSFLKRWRLRISISNERSMNGWSWYDFWDMTSNWNHFLIFFWFSRFASWCNMNVWWHTTYQPYTFLTKRKGSPNIDGVRIVGGKMHSSS
jgi:hypothetical protein